MHQTISILLSVGGRFDLQLLDELCGKLGYRCHRARTGRELIETARSERPSLIVTDAAMPDLAGSEVAEWLKSDPATAGIPIIMITGPGWAGSRPGGPAAGADCLLARPCTAQQLIDTVHHFIG